MEELTTGEVAKALNLSPNTIRVLIREGKIQSSGKFGSSHMVAMSEVERYRAEHLGKRGRKRKEKSE